LPLPPLPEQQAIAAVLSAADREIELLTRELEQQRQIKKYLMQQLLTGRIRIEKMPDASGKFDTNK
jgi:type I restriction enzyme S subunit